MTFQIEELFSRNRFPGGLRFLLCVLYLPAGLILALIRVFIGFHAFVVATVLPKTLFLRKWILRVMCSVLGIIVTSTDDDHSGDSSRSLLVANCIGVFDHMVLDLLKPNFVLLNKPCDGFWAWFGGFFAPENTQVSLKDSINYFFRDSSIQLLTFPEGSSTNGRAMLKFAEWPFDLDKNVQPVVLQARRPLFNISLTLLSSSSGQDTFWHLLCPVTVYHVRFLTVQRRLESESGSEFCRRVQLYMGEASGIAVTKFTANDKKELVKRLPLDQRTKKSSTDQTTRNSAGSQYSRRPTDDRFGLMTRQVKDVLPDVPVSVIEKDLKTSNNVDVTITNLLEGVTPYTPESSSRSTSSPSNQPASHSAPANTASIPAVPGRSFSRSPRDRQLSLAERKQQLIDNARVRYLEKFGSQNS